MNWLMSKLNNPRVRMAATAFVVAFLAVLVAVGVNRLKSEAYTDYDIVKSEEKTDSVARCVYSDNGIVRYSTDGVSLLGTDLKTIWSVACSLQDPSVDVCHNEIVVYDRQGTGIYIFNSKGQVGAFNTDLPIIKACVSKRGTVAALMKDGDATKFSYYTSTGNEIASGKATVSDPGCPVALSLSDDGYNLAISYLTAADGNVGTLIRFYNFASNTTTGGNQSAEFTYSGVFAPEVQYIGNECVVFRDNGFTVYRGGSSPSEAKSVDFDEDIVSTFYDGSHIGFVFQSDRKDARYVARLYSTNGNLEGSMYLDHSYQNVHVQDDMVIFCDRTQLSVFSTRGVLRYDGEIREGTITDAMRVGRKKLMVITDQAIEVIELK